jgi:predicted transcriptional regulator YdeE
MNPDTGKIGALVNDYFCNQFSTQISHRVNPGITYIAYTDYESDEHGEYTVFIGEEVLSASNQDLAKFTQLDIPASSYQKFTTTSGKLPDIVIAAWQDIWGMTPADLGSKRKYHTDFEIYDQRAMDPNNAVVDICIGVI